MKNSIIKKIAYVLFAGLLLSFAGCAGVETVEIAPTEKAADTVETKKSEAEPDSSDYLGEGVVLAAFYAEDGGFSETRYYPAKVLTPGSEETNGEYQLVAMVGDFDVAEGTEHWTDDVILKSHPAQKDELEKGEIVLFTKREVKEGLAEARWEKGIIASTDELYKGVITVDFVWHLDQADEGDRLCSLKIEQIRIIDEWTLE